MEILKQGKSKVSKLETKIMRALPTSTKGLINKQKILTLHWLRFLRSEFSICCPLSEIHRVQVSEIHRVHRKEVET